MSAPIDVQLREYSEFFDSQLAEITVEDVLTERVTRRKVRPLQPRSPRPGGKWAAAAAAALAAAVLIGGAAILIRAGDGDSGPATTMPPAPTEAPEPQPPQPTAAPDPEEPQPTLAPPEPDQPPPTIAPAEVDPPPTAPPPDPVTPGITASFDLIGTGSLDTALGSMTWTKLGVEGAPIAVQRSLFETPDGFGSWDAATGTYWASRDGITWSSSPLPIPTRPGTVRVSHGADWHWLTTRSPIGIWRSRDFITWEQVDVSALAPPDSTGLVWEVRLGDVAEIGTSGAVFWSAVPRLPLDDVLGDRHPAYEEFTVWPSMEGEFVLDVYGTDFEGESGVLLRRIRFEAVPGGGNVVDADTGDLLHEFSVDHPDFASGAGDFMSFKVDLLAVVASDGSLESTDPPWGAEHRPLALHSVQERLYAFTRFTFADARNGTDVWSSADGLRWEYLGAPQFQPEGTDGLAHIMKLAGTLVADVFPPDDGERWLSSDGVVWNRAPAPERFPSIVTVPFAGGFAAWAGATLWISADGTDWERFNTGTFETGGGVGRFNGGEGAGLFGDTLVMFGSSDEIEGVDQVFLFELPG